MLQTWGRDGTHGRSGWKESAIQVSNDATTQNCRRYAAVRQRNPKAGFVKHLDDRNVTIILGPKVRKSVRSRLAGFTITFPACQYNHAHTHWSLPAAYASTPFTRGSGTIRDSDLSEVPSQELAVSTSSSSPGIRPDIFGGREGMLPKVISSDGPRRRLLDPVELRLAFLCDRLLLPIKSGVKCLKNLRRVGRLPQMTTRLASILIHWAG